MSEIDQGTIDIVAQHINERNNKNYGIPLVTIPGNSETPHYFEIVPFKEIDSSSATYYAIDGSTNSQPFYNGLAVAVYRAGYLAYRGGKQLRLNTSDDPVILGQSYMPKNILVTQEDHKYAIYDELLQLAPVRSFLQFLQSPSDNVFSYSRDTVVAGGLATLLGFCQEVLEWALVYEIANRPEAAPGDFILRDGALRSLNIKQEYLVQLGNYVANVKQMNLVAITKNSPIKMELNYTFRQIDNYLQDRLKYQYPFVQEDPRRQKLCCWFEVSDSVLASSYGDSGGMYIRKGIRGGRGTGLFFAARLDYVEKLQSYDWLIVDVNTFSAVPQIAQGKISRDIDRLVIIFQELTRLTQEHYILGYPFPLVEAHNFVTLRSDLKDLIISRIKQSMYQSQGMDHVDIENLFVDIHTRF